MEWRIVGVRAEGIFDLLGDQFHARQHVEDEHHHRDRVLRAQVLLQRLREPAEQQGELLPELVILCATIVTWVRHSRRAGRARVRRRTIPFESGTAWSEMKAEFRVRAPQWGGELSPEEEQKRDRYYREEFLAAKRAQVDRTLWNHFFHDAFHDGIISDIRLDPLSGGVAFGVSCPNVKFHHGEGFRFLTVDYHVVLHQVECLIVERREGRASIGVGGATFGYAEIETCEEEIAEAARRVGDDFHSIIIEADFFNLLAVFRYVEVDAKEPAAT